MHSIFLRCIIQYLRIRTVGTNIYLIHRPYWECFLVTQAPSNSTRPIVAPPFRPKLSISADIKAPSGQVCAVFTLPLKISLLSKCSRRYSPNSGILQGAIKLMKCKLNSRVLTMCSLPLNFPSDNCNPGASCLINGPLPWRASKEQPIFRFPHSLPLFRPQPRSPGRLLHKLRLPLCRLENSIYLSAGGGSPFSPGLHRIEGI